MASEQERLERETSALVAAILDSDVIRERDAEKWDEGFIALKRFLDQHERGQYPPNPYRRDRGTP